MTLAERTTARVNSLITEHLVDDAREVTPTARLVEDLLFDDLDHIEMVMDLEEAFGIQISDEDSASFLTAGDVLAYIEKRTLPQPAEVS